LSERPIAYKYREGKMKRTLKRELKVLEIVKKETILFSVSPLSMLTNVKVSWFFMKDQSSSILVKLVKDLRTGG